jgi:hypothetical protein
MHKPPGRELTGAGCSNDSATESERRMHQSHDRLSSVGIVASALHRGMTATPPRFTMRPSSPECSCKGLVPGKKKPSCTPRRAN